MMLVQIYSCKSDNTESKSADSGQSCLLEKLKKLYSFATVVEVVKIRGT